MKTAPIESGETETGQVTSIAPANLEALSSEDFAPEFPIQADLTGPEASDIRVRNDAVDKAQKAAQAAQEEAIQAARLAQYAQEALTGLLGNIIRSKGLDPSLRYRVDLERGAILPMGPVQGG